jgi:hypothetical protein
MERLGREGVKRLFIDYAKPNKHKRHSAICSWSVELYKLWYTLADFLPNWNFRGVFSIYLINY